MTICSIVRGMKSPNMMSTTGRMPVMAAPTPIPVMPASEMGESITLSVPNSSTRPLSTLKGVPASATSSPMMNTLGSRRSSSARASLIASPKVIIRPLSLCVDMFVYLAGIWIGSFDCEFSPSFYLIFYFSLNLVENYWVSQSLVDQPLR